MFGWFKRPKAVRPRDPESFVSERWDFEARGEDPRWPASDEASHALELEPQGACLRLKRGHLFAWATNPWFQYTDLVLTARLVLPPAAVYGAAGFLFRQVNDANFYAVLLSNRGQLRCDAVFNGRPETLIPWTELPPDSFAPGREPELKLIARGTHLSFHIDGDWVAETVDEHFSSGRVAFAAQTYGPEAGEFRFRRVSLDSRPLSVETEYQRWNELVSPPEGQRLRLSEALFAGGLYAEAARQILASGGEGDILARDDRFRLAQCFLRQGHYAEAHRVLDRVLADDDTWDPARKEKANLYYLENRFLDLERYLANLGAREDDEVLWSLAGHAALGLGRYEDAAARYARAEALNPRLPLFTLNKALALEKAGRPEPALAAWVEAGRGFFRQEAWDDLDTVLARVKALNPGHPEALALEAKSLWARQGPEAAWPALQTARRAGAQDPALDYLEGLILKGRGRLDEALAALGRAVEREPQEPLFLFRYAELLARLERPEAASEAWRAVTLAPEHPWIWNLWGQLAPTPEQRLEAYRRALSLAPGEAVLAVNLAQALHENGQTQEALKTVGAYEGAAPVLNWQGRLRAQAGGWDEAAQLFARAVRLDPAQRDYRLNLADAYAALERFSDLETLLIQLLDEAEDGEVLCRLADLAALKGEPARAEVAYRRALELEPRGPALAFLFAFFLRQGRHAQAEALLAPWSVWAPKAAQEARERLHRARHRALSCDACGRTWWVPKVLPAQEPLRLSGEPPAEAPAGRSGATGKIYCIGCAQAHMAGSRFICPETGEPLKLNDDALRWLVRRSLEGPDAQP